MRDTCVQGYVAPEVQQGSQKYVCSPSCTRDDVQVVEEHASTVEEDHRQQQHHVGLKRKRSSLVKGEGPLYRKTTTSQTPFHNVLFEQKYAVPEYDRDSSTAGNKLVGMSSANLIKSRCFNCGSYGHSIKECWKEHDADRIEKRRREFFASKSSALLYPGEDKRYFSTKRQQDDTGADTENSLLSPYCMNAARQETNVAEKYPHVRPGLLSLRAKEALGMGPRDPPPWLAQMQRLGVSPAYQRQGYCSLPGPTRALPPKDKPYKIRSMQQDADEVEEGQIEEGNSNQDFIPCPHGPPRLEHVYYFPGVNCPPPPGSNLQRWGWVGYI